MLFLKLIEGNIIDDGAMYLKYWVIRYNSAEF